MATGSVFAFAVMTKSKHNKVMNVRAVQHQLSQVELQLQTKPYLLKSTVKPLASAEMTSLVKRVISQNKASFVSTRNVSVDPKIDIEDKAHGVQRVGVKVEMVAGVKNMQAILYKLESFKPYFSLDNLNIKKKKPAKNKPYDNLRVSFEIMAFIGIVNKK